MHALTYDTLPRHSTLRREVRDGVLTITAAAEEPGEAARREAKTRAALPAAMLSGALLVAFLAAIGSTFAANRRNIGSGLMVVLLIAFLVFCAAMFLLVWRAQYAARIAALETALSQTTILAVAPEGLVVETAGPLGQASHELNPAVSIYRLGRWRQVRLILCLEIILPEREVIQIFPGRSAAELLWIVQMLRTMAPSQDQC